MKIVKCFLVLVFLFCLAVPADAANLALMPNAKVRFWNSTGTAPLASGKVYFCTAGSTCPGTPKDTYSDSGGVTANANPVILDARGEATIFLDGEYKVVLQNSAGVTQWTQDNVSSMAYSSLTDSFTQWVSPGVIPTYLSTTSFSVPGDYTSTFEIGRRLQLTVTAGTAYSTVTASSYAASVTTITVANDSTALDDGLTAVNVGLITVANTSHPIRPSVTKTASYNISVADHGKSLISNCSNTVCIFILPTATTVPSGWEIVTKNTGTTWTVTGTPALVSGTVFTETGDLRTTFTMNRRVKATAVGGAVSYHSVASAVYAGGVTTVTLWNDTVGIDHVSGLLSIHVLTDVPLFISGTVNGYATNVLYYNDEMRIWSDGTSYFGQKISERGAANTLVKTYPDGTMGYSMDSTKPAIMHTLGSNYRPAVNDTWYKMPLDTVVSDVNGYVGVKNKTVTISIASPAVISCTGHGYAVNDPIVFASTGALPTGITAGTTYYIITAGFGAASFQISATRNDGDDGDGTLEGDGTPVVTSGSQSGVHTMGNLARITPAAGTYLMIGTVLMGMTIGGNVTTQAIYKNGAYLYGTAGGTLTSGAAGDAYNPVTMIIENANGTDYYELYGHFTTAANAVFYATAHSYFKSITSVTRFNMVRIGK